MTRQKFKALRAKVYKFAGEVGTLAEGKSERHMLAVAYRRASDACDAIDMLGEDLGFIDPETNDFTDRRYKMESGDRMNR
jgi:hypothetical protein